MLKTKFKLGQKIVFKIAKKIFLLFLIFLFAFPFNIIVPKTNSVFASTSHVITTREDWDSGEFNFVESETENGSIKLRADGEWEPRSFETPNLTLSYGASFVSDGTYIYVLRGYGDDAFWKYNPNDDKWEDLASPDLGAYHGADLVIIGNYIYAIFGGNQPNFARYDKESDAWTNLESLPALVNTGGSLATDGTDIYAMRGGSTTVYFYDVSEDDWLEKPEFPSSVSYGDLVYHNGYLYNVDNSNPNRFFKYSVADGSYEQLESPPQRITNETDATIHDGYIYYMRSSNTTDFYRYNLSGGTWETLTSTPQNSRGGVVYHSADNYIYVFRGNSSYDFWKYDISNDSFLGPTDSPVTLYRGSDMLYYNSNFYILRGYNTPTFYEYDISEATWTQKADAPGNIYYYTRGTAAGQYLYFFQGNSTSFYSYDPLENLWTTLTPAPLSTSEGALAYPGSGDYIYAIRGGGTSTFWRYSISQNEWQDNEAEDLPSGIAAGSGSALISVEGDLFLLLGSGTPGFYKYDVSENSWSALLEAPFAPSNSSDIAYDNSNKILAIASNYDDDLYEYNISSNTWRRLANMSEYYGYKLGTANGSSIEYDGLGSFYIVRGQTTINLLKYNPSNYNYPVSGTWISDALDLSYVSSWVSLSASTTTPSDSSINLETRTSSDLSNWSSWESVSEGTIFSPANRYIQIKATLYASTDRTETPKLNDITVAYTGDEVDPLNPSSVTALSQQVGGSSLTSGETYSHAHPYFYWSGSDEHTSVAGYYVYFGASSDANPKTQGNWQTSGIFTVTTPLSQGSYYLRIITKDQVGNESDPVTLFTYVYSGVGADQSFTADETSEFLGTTSNVDVSNDQITLASVDGFWLEERFSLAPAGLQYAAHTPAYVSSTNKLYILRGANDNVFLEYDLTTDTWTTLSPAPDAARMGGGVIEGPAGYLFALQGNNTNKFWRYSIATDEWSDEEASDAPSNVYYGGSMVYDQSRYIYATRGDNTDSFWRYDTIDNTWSSSAVASLNFGAPTNVGTNNAYTGADLVFDGDDTIYAIQGNYQAGFSAYSISSNEWTPLLNLPILPSSGASIEISSDNSSIYYAPGDNQTDLFKYSIASNTWSQMSDAPASISYGGSIRRIGEKLYVIRGGNQTQIYTYNTETDMWKVPVRGLFGPVFQGTSLDSLNYSSAIAKGVGSNFYMIRGNYANDFISYNSQTGEVTRLKDLPSGSYLGASLVYDSVNAKIYYHPGVYWNHFYVYDTSSDTWSEETSDPPPAAPNAGSSMVYDGSRYIYLSRGGWTNSFYRFDTENQSAGTKWETLNNTPASLSYGSELVYKDSYIYTLRGANEANNPFYRYDTVEGTWDDAAVADLDIDVYYEGFLVDGHDGYLYAARGDNANEFYRYSISENSWESLASVPGQVYRGGAAISDEAGKILVFAGAGTNTFNDALYTYVQNTSSSGFQESGTYTSQAHDLTSVYKWGNITLTYQSASDTTLQVETRTSSDGSDWSGWQESTKLKTIATSYEYLINSPANRYIQVRFSLDSTNGIYSGVISDYTINYYQDLTAPSNPAAITTYSSSNKTIELTESDAWYSYTSPYFDWPDEETAGGATDSSTGSGVVGYYVYFGTNESADPAVSGELTSDTYYQAQNLVTGQTYYLRIKTADDAGNTQEEIWQPFIYKFDSTNPSIPTGLEADPSGYSAVDSFSFGWNASSDPESLITSYCYKTGAESGAWSSDQCADALTVSSVPSYKTGANVFYVRSKDSAGNYSDYATVTYYFNTGAPSAPQNLSVTPSVNTLNSFSFSWSAPAVYLGSESNIKYYYSINALPTAQSVTETLTSMLSAGAYATLPGENTFYVVAKDEAGNMDYNNYASITFTANTTAPGIPTSVDIADVSVKATSSWKLAVSWEEPSLTGAGIATYKIYRSIDGIAYTYRASTSGISYVDTGLTQQTYYYKINACDSANNCGEFSSTVSMYPDGKFTEAAPLISDPSVSNITTRKAVVSWTTSRTSDSKVAYGTSSGSYFTEEVSNSDHVTSHTITLTNLEPGTTYYYIAKWTDEDGNTGTSSENTFETSPAPSVKDVSVSEIGIESALITFTVTGASKIKIYYGESTSFGGIKEISTSASESTYTAQLTGLLDGTKYYYKINAFDSEEYEYAGTTLDFETLPRPQISEVTVQQVKGTAQPTLLVTWETNTEVSSIVSYYPLENPLQARDEINADLTKGEHKMIVRGLMPETVYALVIKGRDKVGNEAVSDVINLTTSSDTRPPQITNLKVEGSLMPNISDQGESVTQLVVSWDTDEPSSAQVEFGEGTADTYAQKTQEDSNLTYNHLVVISGLSPSKVYHLRAVSKDKAGNEGKSVDTVTITPKATKSALDLVITNLSEAFGFLK